MLTLNTYLQGPKSLSQSEKSVFEKASFMRAKLSPVSSQWGMEITDRLREQHPWIQKYSLEPHIEEAGEGLGVGFIHVSPRHVPASAPDYDSIGVITIPIVVRELELADLDVFSYKGRFLPLTEQRVDRVLRSVDTFVPADRAERSINLTQNQNALSGSSHRLREAQGYRPLKSLSGVKLSSVTFGAALQAALQEVHGNNAVPLEELTTPDEWDYQDHLKKTASDLSVVRCVEFETRPDSFYARARMSAAPAGQFDGPWEKMSALEIQKTLKTAAFSELLEAGYYVLSDPEDLGKAERVSEVESLVKESAKMPTPTLKKGKVAYLWATSCGLLEAIPVFGPGAFISAHVEPTELSKGCRADRPQFLWCKGGELVTYQDYVCIKELNRATSEWETPKTVWSTWVSRLSGAPQKAIFFIDQEVPYLFSNINSSVRDRSGAEFVTVPPPYLDGPGLVVQPSSSLKAVLVSAVGSSLKVVLPSSQMLPITTVQPEDEAYQKLYSSTKSKSETTPAIRTNVKLAHVNGGYRLDYDFPVPHFARPNGSSRKEVLSSLTCVGIHYKDAVKALEDSHEGAVSMVIPPPQWEDTLNKTAAATQESLQRQGRIHAVVKESAESLKQDALKAAAYAQSASQFVKESAVLDNALDISAGMNFLNEGTVLKFVKLIPKFDEILSDVCALLVASRIGLHELAESDLKATMTSFDKVIGGLRRIEYSLLV